MSRSRLLSSCLLSTVDSYERTEGGEDAFFALKHDFGVFDGVGSWYARGHDPGVFTRGFAEAVAGAMSRLDPWTSLMFGGLRYLSYQYNLESMMD